MLIKLKLWGQINSKYALRARYANKIQNMPYAFGTPAANGHAARLRSSSAGGTKLGISPHPPIALAPHLALLFLPLLP
ncbi:hypothetical protein, partial [Scytonema sp. PRP1]|uniref:hypothetical protein n=1 Tax=Scytonema sp. PRP1 TaxID=3120513 RepID=UPI002FD3539D